MNNEIYKVLTLDEWEQAQIAGLIITETDKDDGFIHLSTASQLNVTLSLYFSNEDRVVLLQLDNSKIQDNLRFEPPSPPGNRTSPFPHYYGDLNTGAIYETWHLHRNAFEIPTKIMLQAEKAPFS